MFQGFTGWHALIILVVILLLFGAPKLPALARSLGQSMKILKSEVRSDSQNDDDAAAPRSTATSTSNDATVASVESTPKVKRADSGSTTG